MNKSKELIIDGQPYSNLQLYKIRFSDIIVDDVFIMSESGFTLKQVQDYYNEVAAKVRPCILLQASKTNDNYGGTTKLISTSFFYKIQQN